MDRTQLTPIAEMLIGSYFETASYSRDFRDSYRNPPTVMAKAHHLRSIMQGSIAQNDAYELLPEYAEFGRVEFIDLAHEGRTYLMRSHGAITIERRRRQSESLFPSAEFITSNVTLLVYDFQPRELQLSVAGAHHHPRRRHLQPTGAPVFISAWSYDSITLPAITFDQSADVDPFEEVGEIDIDGEEGRTK